MFDYVSNAPPTASPDRFALANVCRSGNRKAHTPTTPSNLAESRSLPTYDPDRFLSLRFVAVPTCRRRPVLEYPGSTAARRRRDGALVMTARSGSANFIAVCPGNSDYGGRTGRWCESCEIRWASRDRLMPDRTVIGRGSSMIAPRHVAASFPTGTAERYAAALASRAFSATQRSSEAGSTKSSCHGHDLYERLHIALEVSHAIPRDAAASAPVSSRRGSVSIGRSRRRLGC